MLHSNVMALFYRLQVLKKSAAKNKKKQKFFLKHLSKVYIKFSNRCNIVLKGE